MKISSLARHGLVWLSLALPAAAMAATPVFINELHYNDGGTDNGEAVEIAGPIGTDLSAWSVVLYNGTSSQRKPYDTIALSGTIPANCSGTDGVVVVYPSQIQNGNPDGLALVNGATVVQFLSYGGTFTAADGPAAGMTSTDIGVAENNSTAEGQSLQLTGDGANYEDFTWTGPLADSFGSCNAGQTFGPPVDVAPTVTSTVPADNDTDVATSAALTVNFSEAVTLTAGAITLECASANQPGTLGGSGDAWTFAPTAALPDAASCTATVHAANVTDLDGPPDQMAADATFSFQTLGDYPPTVSAFTPADSATDVDVHTSVTVQFSEPVSLGTGAISLVCGSNAQAGTTTGADADYSFTPTSALPYSVTCLTTVTAADVVDNDGTPTAMVSDATASFTTAAVLPPSVSTTVPVDNASAFPADGDLAVTFSEPVTLTTGWYAIQCATSGAHTAVEGGSGPSYTLDPDADFTAEETCTLTITAAKVHDATANAMAADVVVHFTATTSLADYYQGVDTSSGPALEAWLHTRLTSAPYPYSEIKAYPYSGSSTNTWDILSQADQDPANPDNILDLFKNASLPWQGGGQQAYNREHTWPKSLGFPDSSRNNKPNPPYTDAHMLRLADKGYNSQRGNGLLGNCPDGVTCTPLWTVANGGFGGNHSKHGDANWKDGNTLFEMWNHRKGDVARSLLYMAVRYDGGVDAAGICEPDLQLTDNASLVQVFDAQNAAGCTGPANVAYNGLLSDLLLWNYQDPPDAQEKLRNDLVFSYQRNRNPFVDHPEWALCVFKDIDCDRIFKSGFDGFETTAGNE